MDELEALWLVGSIFGKELQKARQSLDEDRLEELDGFIENMRGMVGHLNTVWDEAFRSGVESEQPTLTKTSDGAIISKGR